jgi:hypothetical protein
MQTEPIKSQFPNDHAARTKPYANEQGYVQIDCFVRIIDPNNQQVILETRA